ncbi:hypothetical protein [Methylomicrobium lacus]|uniref:hypothetical protein n=1 Tax=Methylomicrobium lacus TaxID=136992 RepID=UPI00126904A2|nr:hypothetical protein [Methylomicrobium lacus]
MYSKIVSNPINQCVRLTLIILIGVINVNCASAIDRIEVTKVIAKDITFNDVPCNVRYPLQSKVSLLVCGSAVALQSLGIDVDSNISTMFTLGDDSVIAVNEFPLDKDVVLIGQDHIESIVLIDTGAELCYGTIVIGIAKGNNFYNWGTLDEVVEENGDIHCSSKKISLNISRENVDIIVYSPFVMPKKDGSYVEINQDRKYVFIKNGKFFKKSDPINSINSKS